MPGTGPWEAEFGFGKARFLLERAERHPGRRYLGIEMASKYYRLARDRATRKGLGNLLLIRAEAAYVTSAFLPPGFAEAVHVYFPDPWPKAKHHKRRFFSPRTVDLLIRLLAPHGVLYFASDFLDYARDVRAVLDSHPALDVTEIQGPWDGEARTNYEAKYILEGRSILRLEARRRAPIDGSWLHPEGALGVLAAWPVPEEEGTDEVGA